MSCCNLFNRLKAKSSYSFNAFERFKIQKHPSEVNPFQLFSYHGLSAISTATMVPYTPSNATTATSKHPFHASPSHSLHNPGSRQLCIRSYPTKSASISPINLRDSLLVIDLHHFLKSAPAGPATTPMTTPPTTIAATAAPPREKAILIEIYFGA